MIPETLVQVCDHLRNQDWNLSVDGQDPRIDSAVKATNVVQAIKNANTWSVSLPNVANRNNRSWYNARIDNLYVRVKISRCGSNDNTNAKRAIYWFLTGQDPDLTTKVATNRFFQDMRKNERPDDARDYYYIIVNKLDTSDVFVVSLKGLAKCYPAHNNPPFQAKWDECRTPVNRTWDEAKDLLLHAYATSIAKAIEVHTEGMPQIYPEFFK